MAGLVALLVRVRTWARHRRLVRPSGHHQAVVRRLLRSEVENVVLEAHRILGAGHPWDPKACSEVRIAVRNLLISEGRVLDLRIRRMETHRMDRRP